jgi:hypothetical protein
LHVEIVPVAGKPLRWILFTLPACAVCTHSVSGQSPSALNPPRALGAPEGFVNEVKWSHPNVIIVFVANDIMERERFEGRSSYGSLLATLLSA